MIIIMEQQEGKGNGSNNDDVITSTQAAARFKFGRPDFWRLKPAKRTSRATFGATAAAATTTTIIIIIRAARKVVVSCLGRRLGPIKVARFAPESLNCGAWPLGPSKVHLCQLIELADI